MASKGVLGSAALDSSTDVSRPNANTLAGTSRYLASSEASLVAPAPQQTG